jgi:hypothetical protein
MLVVTKYTFLVGSGNYLFPRYKTSSEVVLMLSFVHPLPEDLKNGLHLQEVQEPIVIPAEYHSQHSMVVLPGVDYSPTAPRPVFAALASPELGITPAQAWESTVAFLYGCEWVAMALERDFQYPLLYADAPPYAREVCGVGDTPLSWIGWVFFVHQVDQALTHLGDPGLARIGTSAEIEAQFRHYVSSRIRQFQQQTTVAPPWFRQMLLMRMGRAPWQEQQQAEETQQQPEQSQQQAEETQQEQQRPEQAQQ